MHFKNMVAAGHKTSATRVAQLYSAPGVLCRERGCILPTSKKVVSAEKKNAQVTTVALRRVKRFTECDIIFNLMFTITC